MLDISCELLVACGDILAQKDSNMPHILRSTALSAHNVRGAKLARKASRLVRSGAESIPETLMRLALVRAGFPEPLVNATLNDSRGNFIARVDLVYFSQRVVLEYDGAHHSNQSQFNKDIDRDRRIRQAGWNVLRFTARNLNDPCNRWLEEVREALNAGKAADQHHSRR